MYEKVEAQKSLGYKKHSCDENPTLFKSPEMNTLMMFYVYDVLHYAIEIIFFFLFFCCERYIRGATVVFQNCPNAAV